MASIEQISSASNCTDYQSRRLGIRYRPFLPDSLPSTNPKKGKGSSSAATRFVHTLNATACAVPRMIICLLENFQQEDGSVLIPEPLRPFMGGLEVLSPKVEWCFLVCSSVLLSFSEVEGGESQYFIYDGMLKGLNFFPSNYLAMFILFLRYHLLTDLGSNCYHHQIFFSLYLLKVFCKSSSSPVGTVYEGTPARFVNCAVSFAILSIV